MSGINATDREQKKRQLKRRIIEPEAAPKGPVRRGGRGENEEAVVRRAERRVRRKHIRRALIVLLILAIAAAAGYYYITRHRYSSYAVLWEKTVPASETGFTGYEKFGDNLLKYTKDGATYVDKSGKAVWSISYQLKSPICYVNGDYAVIGDQQGSALYICNKAGLQGQAATVKPITRVSVSAHGVAAALVEDSKTTSIFFFKSDGSPLDWEIRTVMNKSGYLMDVSLSPEGTQVIASVLNMEDGMLKSRIVFYNFSEFGKSHPDRLVGGFEELGDSLCPRVRFLNESQAVAVADGKIAFFSLENVTSPKLIKLAPVKEEIRSVAYSDKYVALVVDNPDGDNEYRLDIYRGDGTRICSRAFAYQYRQINIDGDLVIMYNENSCKVYNTAGKERFSGEFDFTISNVLKGPSFNTLMVTGGDKMREIRLK